MKKAFPFFAILMSMLIYQNCGGYKAQDMGDNISQSVDPLKELNIKYIEMKRFVDNSGDYYQNVRIEIAGSSIFVVVDESEVCQRTFILSHVERQQVYDLFKIFSYREKSISPTASNLVTEFVLEDNSGNKTEAFVITDPSQEQSIAISDKILDQGPQLVMLIDSLLGKEYQSEQSVCQPANDVPRFVEYIWTDVVNGASIAREAFLFEGQNNGESVFLSLPNSSFCFEAYLLNLHEQAILLKAITRLNVDNNTQTPVNTNGVRYIDYLFEGQQGQRYYIDGRMAPANSQVLSNGEALTDTILAVGAMAQQRYSTSGEQPTNINRCIFN